MLKLETTSTAAAVRIVEDGIEIPSQARHKKTEATPGTDHGGGYRIRYKQRANVALAKRHAYVARTYNFKQF